jgi:hypothetical protein
MFPKKIWIKRRKNIQKYFPPKIGLLRLAPGKKNSKNWIKGKKTIKIISLQKFNNSALLPEKIFQENMGPRINSEIAHVLAFCA